MKTKNSNSRQAIIETAAKLFKEHGFKDTALADIGRAMSKTRTAVYKHFKNKEDLFIARMEYGVQSLFYDLRNIARAEITALKKIKLFCKIKFNYIKDRQAEEVLFHQEIANDPFLKSGFQNLVAKPEIEIMKNIILSGVRSGEFRSIETKQVSMISYIFQTAATSAAYEFFIENNINKFLSVTKVLERMLISSLIK